MEKKNIRTQILQIRDALDDAQRHKKSEEITQKVLASEEYQKAEKVLLFASFRSEVDTKGLVQAAFEAGKEVYFPKVQRNGDGCMEMDFYRVSSKSDLEEGYQGIPEPQGDVENRFELSLSAENIFVLVPGAVFDEQGHRIGYGGGFYDKYLMYLEETIRQKSAITLYKMAVAFECQMVASGVVPIEPYDIPVDAIVTESGIRRCG